MNTEELIERHERGTEILEGIQSFEVRRETQIGHIFGFAGEFAELKKDCEKRLDTINRCIERLKNTYATTMKS